MTAKLPRDKTVGNSTVNSTMEGVSSGCLDDMQHARAEASLKDAIVASIADWMSSRRLVVVSDLNQTFEEGGLDSLDSVELAFFLQDEFGVRVDETVLHHHPTFADLVRYVLERSGSVVSSSGAEAAPTGPSNT